jgi:hypothetical protein
LINFQIKREKTQIGFRFGSNLLLYHQTEINTEILTSSDASIAIGNTNDKFREKGSPNYGGLSLGLLINKKLSPKFSYNFNANACYLLQIKNKNEEILRYRTQIRTFQIQNGISYRL